MESTSVTAEATPPWLDLPRDITATILQKLGAVEILTTAQTVCTTWRTVCRDISMWRRIDMQNSKPRGISYDLEQIYRHAVDFSQGQLTDISMEHFGSDNLLLYISERSSRLRSLRLKFSDSITGEGLSEAIKQFPLLEELHLYYVYIGAEAIEAIGSSCPQLKSFKFNHRGYKYPLIMCNMEAEAIAKSMPGLRHLQIFANKLTNEGLQSILDGCPHLESLDLRQCFNLRLAESLGSDCFQQIKDLRYPIDSTDDYEFDAELLEYDTSDEDVIVGYSDVDMVSDYDDHLEFSDISGSYDYNDGFSD